MAGGASKTSRRGEELLENPPPVTWGLEGEEAWAQEELGWKVAHGGASLSGSYLSSLP